MIQMPRRSVTRFFIPLIDVLTLMFCIYLLMPIIKPVPGGEAAAESPEAQPGRLSAEERQELGWLRQERRAGEDLERLKRERAALRRQLAELQQQKLDTLQQRLAVRVLQIGDGGRLYYYDARRPKDRRIEITTHNFRDFIRDQKKDAAGKDLYLLILYPRVASGNPVYPLQAQREEYDRWFQGVAHGYDVRSEE
jgi:Asp-tRNA(Asn)/Glu-tRNA(Gln) amidotransferase A subunit family amidase